MKRVHGVLALSLAALVLAGCSSPVKLDDSAGAPVESRTPQPVGAAGAGAGAGGAGTAAAGQSQVASVDLGKNDAAATAIDRIVYFDFDSYIVKPEFRPLIEAHAKRLVANRNLRVVVEGHTDERGGREYNLALGQRRAEAVVRSLTLLGVNEGQLEAVSFGEERPAVTGSNEEAWAKNRRAELKDR
ncbi:peptidoglycan-associated lipoprotein Pal [Azohydromonas sediminis]|uniref:peptidoglycan-associated lipoprotein Pal n=1 Tax=Azohydromonas sediminis TaxID=2259674 RepID=UPI000E658A18|nr:peptidoglycan-associated lipoprotein Pal [Azohydromonas sediminis]